MKQGPKTISEKKRISYVKKGQIKCFLPNLEGQVVVNNIRKYTDYYGTTLCDTIYNRYEIDVTFQGQLKAIGPRGYEWYTMKEIKEHPSFYDIRRVNKILRPKLLEAMKSKLQILGFDLNYCEVKKVILLKI